MIIGVSLDFAISGVLEGKKNVRRMITKYITIIAFNVPKTAPISLLSPLAGPPSIKRAFIAQAIMLHTTREKINRDKKLIRGMNFPLGSIIVKYAVA